MSLKDDLWAYLNGTPGVTAVFSNTSPDQVRIYPQILPQRPTYPAATYQLVGQSDQLMMNATTNDMVQTSLNVDVYSDNSEDAETGAAAIIAALRDYRGEWSGRHVNRVRLDNKFDLSDVEPGLYRVSMTFTIWHDE